MKGWYLSQSWESNPLPTLPLLRDHIKLLWILCIVMPASKDQPYERSSLFLNISNDHFALYWACVIRPPYKNLSDNFDAEPSVYCSENVSKPMSYPPFNLNWLLPAGDCVKLFEIIIDCFSHNGACGSLKLTQFQLPKHAGDISHVLVYKLMHLVKVILLSLPSKKHG